MQKLKKVAAYFKMAENHWSDFRLSQDNLMLQGRNNTSFKFPLKLEYLTDFCLHLRKLPQGKKKKKHQREECSWFSVEDDKEHILNHLFLPEHVNVYFDVPGWGGGFWPLQRAFADISLTWQTDRGFNNPLKPTAYPLVKTVPVPHKLEAKDRVEML